MGRKGSGSWSVLAVDDTSHVIYGDSNREPERTEEPRRRRKWHPQSSNSTSLDLETLNMAEKYRDILSFLDRSSSLSENNEMVTAHPLTRPSQFSPRFFLETRR